MRCLVVLLVLTLLTAVSANPETREPAPGLPAGGPSFKRPLTLSVRDKPLWELLRELRASLKLPLRADASTQDERITLFCRERPAGEILAAIARHLDYTWVRKRRGESTEYVLTQILAARKREQQLRDAGLAGDYAVLRKRADEMVARARRPPEERRQQAIAHYRKLRDEAKDPQARQEFSEAVEDLENGTRRRIRPCAETAALEVALLLMQPADWERLWQGVPFRFSYPARPGRRALTGEQAAAMVRCGIEELTESAGPDGSPQPGTFAGVDRVRGEVVLRVQNGSPALEFRCRLVGRQPDLRAHRTLYGQIWSWAPDAEKGPSEPHVDPKDSKLQRTVEIPPRKEADPKGIPPKNRNPDLVLADVLEALAPVVPYTLIADSYDRRGGYGLELPRGPQRLDAWLRRVLKFIDVQVRREGTTLYFRHEEWARLRPIQVPERLSRRWETVFRAHRALPLRSLCEIAGTLSDDQVSLLLERWRRRGITSEGESELLQHNLDEKLEGLRLLQTLAPIEWARLFQADHPPVLLQRPAQVALLARWLTAPNQDNHVRYEGPGHEPEPRPLEALLDDEERLEAGATTMCLRAWAEAGTFYYGERGFVVPSRDPEEAVRIERGQNPKATREDVRRLEGAQYTIGVYPDPEAEEALTGFNFVTPDLPQLSPKRP
jgi:hypothetical protein